MSKKKDDLPLPPPNEIVFYETENGKISIAVRFENENVWLTQKLMAELFGCSTDNISLHLKNIYMIDELSQASTTEEFSVVQQEGNRSITRKVLFYNLEAVIAVGYRVNSERGIAFRSWATDKLKNYIFKGFAIDSERFKKGSKFDTRFFDELLEEIREIRASERMVYQKITDIYATSIDYSPKSEKASKFFSTVQNKLHFAITGSTAAEIIAERAQHDKPVVYISEACVKSGYEGKSIGRRLMECILTHYPEGTEFYILTRKFNQEAITLYRDRLKFTPITLEEILKLDYDDRYVGFKHKTTEADLALIKEKRLRQSHVF